MSSGVSSVAGAGSVAGASSVAGRGPSFDVIVVGGGGSGAPLAARLSEDPSCRVLLLEAGPAPLERAGMPAAALDAGTLRGADPGHPLNWSHPALLAAGRPYSIARGRVIGGSTAVNGGYFVRARRSDFDAWERHGGVEWGYEACLPALRRLESDAQFGADAARHGASGPMPVTRTMAAGGGHPVTRAFEAAARAAGHPLEADKNGEQPAGWGPLPVNVRGGERWSTALGYLVPARGRPNLTVRGGCLVRRVLIEGGRAVGVELQDAPGASEAAGFAAAPGSAVGAGGTGGAGGAGGADYSGASGVTVVRGGMVVLAAGAIGTPTLLLRSGVGPADGLRRAGVDVAADSPGVGTGWSDHPQIALDWRPRPGVLADDAGAAFAPPMESVLNARHGDAEVEVLPLLKPLPQLLGAGGDSDVSTMLVAVQNPEARGRIALSAADPEESPTIAFHYIETAGDRRRMREAVRAAAAIVQSEAFAEVAEEVLIASTVLPDDDELDRWVREHLGTALHSCGSARLGRDDDPLAVVDAHGRVRGVSDLRIADLSLIPTVPLRGPANTAVLVGERLAELIAAER